MQVCLWSLAVCDRRLVVGLVWERGYFHHMYTFTHFIIEHVSKTVVQIRSVRINTEKKKAARQPALKPRKGTWEGCHAERH